MQGFQQYQAEFTSHIRAPETHKKPAKVNRRRMGIYREIAYNNIYGSVETCFPVLLNILGKRRFKQLVRQFFSQQRFSSPLFREIPKTFVDYLQNLDLMQSQLPPFTAQLAHYEWAELAVSHLPDCAHVYQNAADLLDTPIALAPHMLLAYDYPVHRLSRRHHSDNPTSTYILMFRTLTFEIKFIELNATTHSLLALLATQTLTGRQALLHVAQQMQHPQPETIVAFGLEILQDLQQRQAILGHAPQ